MRARLLLNVFLLMAVVLLAAWIHGQGQKPKNPGLSALDAETVERIEIERREGPNLTFIRVDQGWRMLEPRELPASAHHVDMMLRFLQQSPAVRYATSEVDLVGAGLHEPRLVLHFDDQRFEFGDQDPLSARRYLLHEGEVLLLQEGVSAVLQSPWWNFIDRRLLPTGAPLRLRFADGRVFEPDDIAVWQRQWQQGQAAIVEPQAAIRDGDAFELELESGERLGWQWLTDEKSYLLRPDLGLAYQVTPDQLEALLGGASSE